MGCYCCVRGCNNKSGNKKKTPDSIITFHAFPSNPELKKKWVKAIGRPDWSPPAYARICSSHFDYNQLKSVGCRTRIQDDAVPLQCLPLNSNFEASNVEVCRICLAVDIKMYSILNGTFKSFMESITTFTHNQKIEGLPNVICYLCFAVLRKSYGLVEYSMLAQTLLLDIFVREGQITKSLVKSQRSMQLNIKPCLTKHSVTTMFQYEFDEEQNISILKNNQTILEIENNIKYHELAKEINQNIDVFQQPTIHYEDSSVIESKEIFFDDKASNNDFESDDEAIEQKINDCDDESHLEMGLDDSDKEDNKILSLLAKNSDSNKANSKPKKKNRKKEMDGLTQAEASLQKFFDIVKLSVPQQILEWNKSIAGRKFSSDRTIFKCEICFKTFANSNTYIMHIGRHDPKRGDSVCQICKLRCKSDTLMRKHAKSAHAIQFHCKICHKVYNYVRIAKKHHLWHTGHKYKCAQCSFASVHECSLSIHVRSRHCSLTSVCSYCGHGFVNKRGLIQHLSKVHGNVTEPVVDSSYRCEECDISFVSEGARRMHFLTSVLHKHKTEICSATSQDTNKNCKTCGEQFPSTHEMFAHARREHSRTNKSMPGDQYPAQCEHCDVTVNSRSEHWKHVNKVHRALRHHYRAVVTAVCQTCGKGFQTNTKLRHHMLRHSPASLRCDECPRLFYDKYAVQKHKRSVHTDKRGYQCGLCHKKFAASSNLYRHYRVHTGDTPYECSICKKKFKHSTSLNLHVRTVHYKMPHPPRKKRIVNKSSEDHVILENQ